jgi:hypothetical protein
MAETCPLIGKKLLRNISFKNIYKTKQSSLASLCLPSDLEKSERNSEINKKYEKSPVCCCTTLMLAEHKKKVFSSKVRKLVSTFRKADMI